jgi:hypothetical protein
VRAALVTSAIAVLTVVGAGVFVSSLDGLRRVPRRFGVTWDASAGGMATVEEAADGARKLTRIAGVAAFSGASTNAITIAGRHVTTIFIRRDHGLVEPLVVEGRAPTAPDELALGADTMSSLGVHVGDRVRVEPLQPGRPIPFRVVGRAVLNTGAMDTNVSPGSGAMADWSAIARLSAPEDAAAAAPQIFLIRYERGADPATVTAEVRKQFPGSTTPPVEPSDTANLADVSALPLVLGAVLGLLGLGATLHALFSAVRRRSHELAVARSLGFLRRQVRTAVLTHALTIGAVALLVGLPLGLAAGRAAWSITTHQLAVVDHPVVPALATATGAASLVVLLAVIAAVPGRRAASIRPATVLRAE